MSQSSGSAGPDFHLPDEILSVMPTDPYDQLDLARKITSMAIASRVSNLESEVGRMRQKVFDKDRLIGELEEKVSELERANQEKESQLRIAVDENVKLSNERDSLAATTKKLSRDLMKLETFKRQLIQSLSDENSSQAETVDIETCDQATSKAYVKDESSNGYMAPHSFGVSAEHGNTNDETSRHAGNRFSITPFITPRLTPTGTPKIISIAGSPRGYSTAGSPQMTSGATSPTKPHVETRSSWYASSQQSSAASSPPRGRALSGRNPRVDGKEFFRQARSRLSYEQFSAFLANIKDLNARKQSREETLRKAEEIFGIDNKDLYLSFQGLLNRMTH